MNKKSTVHSSRFSALKKIPLTVWAIGFASLFINSSTVILFTTFPDYLTNVLMISMTSLGVIEGFVEFTSWFTRLFSGVISDALQKRKPLLLAAFSIATISRFIFPIATNVTSFVAARSLDRVANGLQASPRDALVGEAAPVGLKGTAYGLRQTLSYCGSFLGAGLLLILFGVFGHQYQLAFYLATVLCALALVILFLFVKDEKQKEPLKENMLAKSEQQTFSFSHILDLKPSYWGIVALASIFMFSNYSGAFMILHTQNTGLEMKNIAYIMLIQNFASLLSAYPAGRLSDKFGRENLLFIGFGVVIIANILLCSSSLAVVLAGVAVWGIQMGINQSILTAKVADTSQPELRATAFGIYFICVGLSLFLSNTISGKLSDLYGITTVFMLSSCVAAFAMVALYAYNKAFMQPEQF